MRHIAGIMVDLTSTVRSETERAARDATAGAIGTRSVIERARGILMGRLGIGADRAFALLCVHSNNTNKRLSAIAAQLIDLAEDPQKAATLTALIRRLQLPPAAQTPIGTPGTRRAAGGSSYLPAGRPGNCSQSELDS